MVWILEVLHTWELEIGLSILKDWKWVRHIQHFYFNFHLQLQQPLLYLEELQKGTYILGFICK